MQKILSLLMGIEEGAGQSEIRKHYQKLISAFLSCEYESSEEKLKRYQSAREKLSKTYESYRKQQESGELKGKVRGNLLGEILVDCGVISQADLDDALKAQSHSKAPLGKILVACKLISWEQLAYYLRLQDLLQLPADHPDRLSRQLVELGLTSKQEIETAVLDCETTGCSMAHAVARRGWVKAKTLAILTGANEKANKDEKSQANNATKSATALPV